jgi:hypothetical protein
MRSLRCLVSDQLRDIFIRVREVERRAEHGRLPTGDDHGDVVVPVDRNAVSTRRLERPILYGRLGAQRIETGRQRIDHSYIGGRAVGPHRVTQLHPTFAICCLPAPRHVRRHKAGQRLSLAGLSRVSSPSLVIMVEEVLTMR